MSYFGVPLRNGVGLGLGTVPSLTNTPLSYRLGPSLDLVFAGADALDPRITFTRSTTATFTGSNGLVQSAAINAPRFDYNPTTLAPLGLLIEEQRTNLCLYSGSVGGTGWGLSNGGVGTTPTVTLDAAIAPDGTSTASRIQLSLGGGTTTTDQALVTRSLTGTSCRGSFYIKTNDNTTKTIYVRGFNAASIVVNGVWQRYDFDAGTLSTTQFGIGLRGGQTLVNSNTADILVWGAQLEAGAFPTSYIPTVASQVTRTADNASMTGTNFSSWFNATEGTLFGQGDVPVTNQPGQRLFGYINNTANNNGIGVGYSNTAFNGIVVDSTVQANITGGSYTANVANKAAFGFKANDFALYANNVSIGTDLSGTIPTVDSLLIGKYGPAGNLLNGHIKKITYYPRRLSNAELQGITA